MSAPLKISAASLASMVVLAIPALAQEPIRIGVLLPLTGPFAKGGQEDLTAMEITRDMINEKGGINGRKIEYLRGDAVNPNAAISEAERLRVGPHAISHRLAEGAVLPQQRDPEIGRLLAQFVGEHVAREVYGRPAVAARRPGRSI